MFIQALSGVEDCSETILETSASTALFVDRMWPDIGKARQEAGRLSSALFDDNGHALGVAAGLGIN